MNGLLALARSAALDFLWVYRMQFRQRSASYLCKLRFMFRTIVFWRASRNWYSYLRNGPHTLLAPGDVLFVERPHRPFFDHRLSANQRVDMMVGHYVFFYSAFNNKLANNVMQCVGWKLSSIYGKSGLGYDFVLNRDCRLEKEGCLVLQMQYAGAVILSLSFTFALDENLKICIGGLQSALDSSVALRVATQDLHGIQPRFLIICALRCLCTLLRVQKIEAIDDKNHIYMSWRTKRKNRIRFSYDAVWSAVGGVQQANGRFAISPVLARIDWESKPPNKRAQYRRRAVMLDSFYTDMNHNMRDAVR